MAPEFRPIEVILQCKFEDITTAEIERVLQELPLRHIPTDILLSFLNREYGTSYKSIDDLPDGWPPEWRDPEK